ncbi:MAG: hypothetical protein HOV80_00620 [Polyangiaceae bacterium]|nr:hypothetical protein [Polyangiaceae bacterium]
MRSLVAFAAIPLVFTAIACTAFEDLEPAAGGSPPVGGGGSGGAEPDGPRSLLPLLDAANLCSLVFRCPTLGGSILLSTGLPLVQTDDNARPTVWNYSACIDWLTAPLEAGHSGFEDLREIVLRIAPTTTCADAASVLPFDVAEDPPALCTAQPPERCESADNVSCPNGVTSHCEGLLFAPGSSCGASLPGETGCASASCTTPELKCNNGYAFNCSADGLKSGYLCGVFGLSCADGVGCVAAAGKPSCTTIGTQACVGARSRTCAISMFGELLDSEIDCDAMGMTCAPAGTTARCAPPTGCSPYDPDQNVCSGSVISICAQGVERTIDCTVLGKQCISASTSQSAHCN